jgi:hypothetical protein
VDFNISNLHKFLRGIHCGGQKIGLMDAVITAFVFMLRKHPELNRFVANKRVYQRDRICVSFVMLKKGDGESFDETAVKLHMEPDDDLLSISKKIRDVVAKNEKPQSRNALDVFVGKLMGAPLVPGFLVGSIKLLDKFGLVPRRIIELSPFHTSLFISNLASLRVDYAYHHLYEFGTTSLFVTLGIPRRVADRAGGHKRVITLGASLDDRISTGAAWARGFFELKKMLENPELLLGELEFEKV